MAKSSMSNFSTITNVKRKNMKTRLLNNVDISLLIVRILLGSIIAAHGAQKIFGWFGGYGFDATIGFFTQTVGVPYLLAVAIILIESIGMLALIAGLLGRVISSALIAIMIGAIVTTHAGFGFFMNWSGTQAGEGFEFHLLVIALSSVVVINGSGVYSIDHILGKKLQTSALKKTSLV
jgi:putative oxidoreductase